MKGWLITLEGPEGGGKSTQIALLRDFLKRAGVPCTVVREPGGTEIGDRIRGILLDPRAADMTVRTEILLYAASRAQLVERVILPALRRGEVVLCDRFVDSSIAYQGFGTLWDREEIRLVNRVATGGLRPDRTYLLDVPVEGEHPPPPKAGAGDDRIERKGKEYHERVRQGFLHLASSGAGPLFGGGCESSHPGGVPHSQAGFGKADSHIPGGRSVKLIIAVVQDRDSNRLSQALVRENIPVTKLASTGGFLREGNTTFLIGVGDDQVEKVLRIIRENSQVRKNLSPPTWEGTPRKTVPVRWRSGSGERPSSSWRWSGLSIIERRWWPCLSMRFWGRKRRFA